MRTDGKLLREFPYPAPGVYFEETTLTQDRGFVTGVPAFLGFVGPTSAGQRSDGFFKPYVLTDAKTVSEGVGKAAYGGFVDDAVRGFFENGGQQCVVIRLPQILGLTAMKKALQNGLLALDTFEDVDLICAPDLPAGRVERISLQCDILEHCRESNRFAILDSPPPTSRKPGQRTTLDFDGMAWSWRELMPRDGSLYYPWIRVRHGTGLIPPCGHVAGIFSRVDSRVGVHRAPANEVVEGAVDLQMNITDGQQHELRTAGVNCIRSIPGRGIRVWDARTLNGLPEWRQINVRRLFITMARWIDRRCLDLVFEAHSPELWERVRGRLVAYCYALFQKGALAGRTPAEAFYVKCDKEINPPDRLDAGEVISEIGLAPVKPAEFVVVRITHNATGTTFNGPQGPG